jgi:hypothetical protein
MLAFVVQHAHELEDGEDEVKMIGVYSTRENAESAVERLRLQPGFRDTPNCFFIDDYTVDQTYWTEGYVTTDVDYPSWVNTQKVVTPSKEKCEHFVATILNDKYGSSGWISGPDSEFSKTKKACNRGSLKS